MSATLVSIFSNGGQFTKVCVTVSPWIESHFWSIRHGSKRDYFKREYGI